MIYGFLVLATAAAALDPLIAEICARSPTVASLARDWCSASVPVCQWQGVTCYNLNGVDTELELALQDVPLAFDLPLVALASTQIQAVVLSNCDVGGSLASAQLSSAVKRLDLSHNSRLRDFVSSAALASLFELRLHACGIASDISDELCGGEHADLTRLDLSHNAFFGDLSACVGGGGSWDAVSVFNVSHNALGGRAPAPPNSVSFDVSENQFSALEEILPKKTAVSLGEAGARNVYAMKKCRLGTLTSAWSKVVPACRKN